MLQRTQFIGIQKVIYIFLNLITKNLIVRKKKGGTLWIHKVREELL